MKTINSVNTRKPYRIDVHHHVLPKLYFEALERLGKMTTFGVTLLEWSLESHLEVMDKNKIAVGMASIPTPGIHFESDALSRDFARQCNEYLAYILREHPDRFGAFATLPLPDVDGTLKEAIYALGTLKMDGVMVLSNVLGRYIGDPENDELFAELNRHSTVVFVHPGDPPDTGIPDTIRFPIDTALETVRAVMSLLYNGVLERYQQIKFIFAHCGGITPYLAHRIAFGKTWLKEQNGVDPGMLGNRPFDAEADKRIGLMQRQYYDSMTANAATGWQTLQAFVDQKHILLGTDYAALPAKYQPIKMRELMGYKGFDEETRMGVERENALRLFPRLKEVLE